MIFEKFRQANARVVTLCHDIDHPRFAYRFDAHFRVADHVVDQQRIQEQGANIVGNVQAQGASRLIGIAVDLFIGLTDFLQRRADPRHIALPGVGKPHAAGGAVIQTGLQAAFQPGNGVAHGGGRHPQLLGGGAKAAATYHCHHHFQLDQS